MRRVLNTREVGLLFAMSPGSVSRYARQRGVTPLPRVRVGRSWVTRWAVEDLVRIAPAPDRP